MSESQPNAAGKEINISFAVENAENSNIQIMAYTGGTNNLHVDPRDVNLNPGDLRLFRVKGEANPGDDMSVIVLAIPFNSAELEQLDGKAFKVSIQVKG